MKYTLEFKMECILKHKEGICESPPGLDKKSFMSHVRDWEKIYDDFGIDGLKHRSTNKIWTKEEKFDLVAKVLAGNSISSVSRNNYINPGQLYLWLRKYNESGFDGLECIRGRRPKMSNKTKLRKKTMSQSEEEELKLLKEENKYLKIENEYLKKLDALVSKKEAARAKARKQK